LSFLQPSASAQQVRDDINPDGKWEVLTGCQLVTNALVDGDSFHVLHGGREYVFRLYFVDAPEKDPSLRERIVDQAAYFGVNGADIPGAGVLAARFTRDKLSATNFTVITRWQNAMGRSALARFCCVVSIGDENLAEELVAQGWARIYGLRANWPGGMRSTTFINTLKNLELGAREKHLGVWNEKRFPRATEDVAAAGAGTNQVAVVSEAHGLLDLNSATAEELADLPAIGPVLAQRILERRPYARVEDLKDVAGIGAKTFEKLKPLVSVSATAKP
jgi:competence protein ComEA